MTDEELPKCKKGHFSMSFFHFCLSQKTGICYTVKKHENAVSGMSLLPDIDIDKKVRD